MCRVGDGPVRASGGLQAHGLTKYLGGNAVLQDFDISIAPGEIHGLVGENGSGKSTFIKILSGYHVPEPGGVVLVDGAQIRLGSASSSYEHGCRFVHQDLGLIERRRSWTTSISPRVLRRGSERSVGRRSVVMPVRDLARIGLDLDPRQAVGSLSAATKTGVAMARALSDDRQFPVKVLVLDEPTAALPVAEVRQVLQMVRSAAETGVAVLYVTHRIDELFLIADNVSVLRNGRKVATRPMRSLTRPALIELLVGSELEEVKRASRSLAVRARRADDGSARARVWAVAFAVVVGACG